MLPWENRAEYDALLDALNNSYAPNGATEHYLVMELANIIFRKQRLQAAEHYVTVHQMAYACRSSFVNAGEDVAALEPNAGTVRDYDKKAALHAGEEENKVAIEEC